MEEFWRKCSTCKKEIPYRGLYYVCSVSTCQTKSRNYIFCSVPCWDAHIPVERHRGDSAGALERQAPRQGEEITPRKPEKRPEKKRIIVSQPSGDEGEILVVASKVKKYIHEKSGLNTSAGVMNALTARVQRICDGAVEEARRQGRKTVMDRDVP